MMRDVHFVTFDRDKHKLVHVGVYGTIEPPRPKKKGIFYLHAACGAKIARGAFKTLGERSRRKYVTCLRCARHAFPKR